ncbi:MAG: DsrE family protein [Nocardioidaceae bacterium]|nr:DsrE family protein [Nocardioidaceae bacterium]MCL2614520.1 DsrE family protein [Nocardioidaceae bacterium]
MPRSLVVKVTCGADAPERCNQGLTVAATAAAGGVPVSLWLTGEGAWLGVAGRPSFDLPHAVAPDELVATVLAAGSVTVCGQCAARREIAESDLRDGARIAGAARFVEEAMDDGVQALVY